VKAVQSAIGAGLRGLADALTAVLFPAPCRICGEMLDNAGRVPLCSTCLASLRPYAGQQCARCGRPIVSQVATAPSQVATAPSQVAAAPGSEAICLLCRRGVYDFDFARSYGAYTEAMAAAVILLKYQQVTPLAGWFASRLRDVAKAHLTLGAFGEMDVLIPVPQHATRQRERGYNHAELIARPLARALGLPCRSLLLLRNRPRPEKLRLTVHERWSTVRGAYGVRQGARVDNLRVLLVDDVFTTGATLDSCSRALRRAGAAYVAALTVARALPHGQLPDVDLPPKEPDK
jgi:ComF family protein